MIATVGLPGSNTFRAVRVRSRAEASSWRAAWLAEHGESQQTLGAVRDGLTLTERDASRSRWRDGSKIYDDHLPTAADEIAEWTDRRSRLAAAAACKKTTDRFDGGVLAGGKYECNRTAGHAGSCSFSSDVACGYTDAE